MPFAMQFGESLGMIFRFVSEDIQNEIFEQINRNVIFANGTTSAGRAPKGSIQKSND